MIRRLAISGTAIAAALGLGVALVGGARGMGPLMLVALVGMGSGAAVLLRSARRSAEV
ncbi:MAG: hypothetical protein QOE05_2213, partial [Actinomycetota bacterium]|nr:hypothetical protein [Actinomycetota bacterium]